MTFETGAGLIRADRVGWIKDRVGIYVNGARKELHELEFREQVQLESMRAEELLEWMKQLDGRTFSPAMLQRVGFFEKVYVETGNLVLE